MKNKMYAPIFFRRADDAYQSARARTPSAMSAGFRVPRRKNFFLLLSCKWQKKIV